MPEQGIRQSLSQCPFQIVMCDDSGALSAGTAFFFEDDGACFLVTNWHNFSGRSPFATPPTSPPERSPAFIQAKFFTLFGDGTRMTAVAQRVEIYDANGPKWYEHPDFGSRCDVVALPLPRPESCPPHFHKAANRRSSVRVPVVPGGTVFIIGFPQSISIGQGLPLWKSGYIASEPYFDVTIGGQIAKIGGLTGGHTIPAFFIDSRTREGMSGSPVFASYTGAWDTTDPYASIEDADLTRPDIIISGTAVEFVGCYSGRVGSSEHEAELGLCWRAEVIEAICSAKRRGPNPH